MNNNIQRIINNLLSDESMDKTASSSQDVVLSRTEDIIQSLEKVASDDNVVQQATNQLRAMNEEINKLNSQNNELVKAAEVREVAEDMNYYGMINPEELEEKIAEMLEYDSKELKRTKEAVKLASQIEATDLFEEVVAKDGKRNSIEEYINDNIRR